MPDLLSLSIQSDFRIWITAMQLRAIRPRVKQWTAFYLMRRRLKQICWSINEWLMLLFRGPNLTPVFTQTLLLILRGPWRDKKTKRWPSKLCNSRISGQELGTELQMNLYHRSLSRSE